MPIRSWISTSVFSYEARPYAAWQIWAGVGLLLITPLMHAQENDPQPAAEKKPLVQQKAETSEVVMGDVEVRAQSMDTLETRTYTREEMDRTPQSDRDITSLIASHPAVRLNPSVAGAGDHGSLAPEDFSIHGQSPYQNQFLIDGVSSTNVINPHVQDQGMQTGRVAGFSQAYNLDTDLLEAVEVHDSKVPVEFGGFSGGVVAAQIKKPQGTNSWKVKRSFNSSNLTQQRIAAGKTETDWLTGAAGYSPVWKKHFTSIQGDVRVTEDSSMLLSFSRRQSEIERQQKILDQTKPIPSGKDTLLETTRSDDQVDNLLAKVHTNWGGGTETSLVLKYADRQQDLVSNSYADSAWTNQQNSYGVAGELKKPVALGELTLNASWDDMRSARKSDGNSWVTQSFEDTQLTSYTYGSFGSETLKQSQLAAKLRLDVKPFSVGEVSHKMYGGLDFHSTRAVFERNSDITTLVQKLVLDGSQTQSSKNLWKAGTAEASYNTWGLYFSESLQWRNFGWTLGVRVDRDNLFKNTNFAPRTRWDWDIGGHQQSALSVGWARYFGVDMLGYALEHDKSKLKVGLLDQYGIPKTPVVPIAHSFTDVRTPYSDEWAASFKQQLTGDLEAQLSYVRRSSRDGVTRSGTDKSGYFYDNRGRGEAETWTLSLLNTNPMKALGADWSARMDWSWQDSEQNHDLTAGWSADEYESDEIMLDGQLIQRNNLPSAAFAQPQRVDISWGAGWKQYGVVWGNRLRWNSSRNGITQVLPKQTIPTYFTQKMPSYWTWDTSVTWKPQALRGMSLNVEVLNVLNKITPIAVSSLSNVDTQRYQTGREIWLNVSYEF